MEILTSNVMTNMSVIRFWVNNPFEQGPSQYLPLNIFQQLIHIKAQKDNGETHSGMEYSAALILRKSS